MSLQNSQKERILTKTFLFLFIFIGIYIRFLLLGAPISSYALQTKVFPNMELSPLQILGSEFHSELAHWRMIFSNYLYQLFGLTEITYRMFPFLASVFTFFFIYKFTKQRIGEEEAQIAVLLFSSCYYSYWSIIWPHFPAFYFLASLATIHFLLNAIEKKDCLKTWTTFAIVNLLNLTNVILPFLFLPSIFFVGIWFIAKSEQRNEKKNVRLEVYKKFLIFFSIPVLIALAFYEYKGVNVLKNAIGFFQQKKFVDPVFSPVPGQEYFQASGSPIENLKLLLENVFLKLNFYNGDLGIEGSPFSHGCFFLLFLLGQYKLFKSKNNFFSVLAIIFFPSVLILSIIFHLKEARFLAFVLPFYLISAATGFWFLFNKLGSFYLSGASKKALIYVAGFLIFFWLIPSKPIWSHSFLDETYHIKGIRYIRDYLRENIKPNDIILNVTRTTELRGEVWDALSMPTYEFYLDEFFDNHSLETLPSKEGRVGIWLILQKPKEDEKELLPFYLPPGLELKLVSLVYGGNLYYGYLNMDQKRRERQFYNDPFWTFIFARYYHKNRKYNLAEQYYKRSLSFGLNRERSFYNLGLMHSSLNYKIALEFFKKAIQIIETPTQIPESAEIILTKPKILSKSGMAAKVTSFKTLNPIRSFYLTTGDLKRRVWVKKEFVYYNGRFYSEFYITPGLLSYLLFDQTGDQKYFQDAKNFFSKGLKLFPKHSKLKLIKNLMNDKPRNVSIKDFNKIYVADLNAIYEEFSPKKFLELTKPTTH